MKSNFIKGTAITFTTRILNLLIGIVVSIMLARLLGPEGRGIYALAILIPSFAVIFTNWGITSASVYYLGKKKYPPQLVAGNNIVFNTILSVGAIIIMGIILIFFKNSFFTGVPTNAIVLVLLAIPFLKLSSTLNYINLGIHRYFVYNILSLVGVIVQIIIFLILVLTSSFSLLPVIITYLISSFVVFLITFIVLKQHLKKFYYRINKDYLKDTFNYGSKAFLGSIISFFHLRIDQLIINYFLNPIAVGFYAVAVGLTERLWLLAESTSVILFPKISSETDEEAKKNFTPVVCRNILLLTVIGALTLFLLGRWLILLLYSADFLDALLPFQILLLGTISVSGSKILANDIAGRGKPIINTYINITSLIVNVILNIIFIPRYGISGAAYATTISYTLVFLIRVFIYARISGNKVWDIVFIKMKDWQLYKDFIKSIFNRNKEANVQSE